MNITIKKHGCLQWANIYVANTLSNVVYLALKDAKVGRICNYIVNSSAVFIVAKLSL